MQTRGGKRFGAGRKKGFSALEAEKARELICQKLSESFEPIINTAIKQAKNGDRHARSWLVERAYGKIGYLMHIEEEKDLPIPIMFGLSGTKTYDKDLIKELTNTTNEYRRKHQDRL